MEKYIYKEEYQYPTAGVLNVTDDCNLQCRYCFVEQHPHYMTLDVAKTAVDWLYNNYQKKKELQALKEKNIFINFFGGEPLLCYDSIIVPLVEYTNEKYPNHFKFGITTNGTLLDERKLKFLKDNNFGLLLSIDGNKETQEFNRPHKNLNYSSFELVKSNLDQILEVFPYTLMRATIYPLTVQHLYENFLYLESIGCKCFSMVPDLRHSHLWTPEKIEILKNEIMKIYLYQINKFLNNEPTIGIYPINDYLGFLINHYCYEDENSEQSLERVIYRCGLGNIGCSIAWDGNIYGCQEQPSRDNKNIFLIGNVFDGGIDIQKHNILLSSYISDKEKLDKKNECQECSLKDFCQNAYLYCPSQNFDLFNNMWHSQDIECILKKYYVLNSILLIQIISSCKNIEQCGDILNQELGKRRK